MGAISDQAAIVFRPYVVAGLPSSGINQPAKSDVVGLFAAVESAVAAGGGGGSTVGLVPRDDTSPSLSISHAPLGNSLTTLSALVTAATTQSSTTREFVRSGGLTNNQGGSASAGGPRDKVHDYLSTVLYGSDCGDGWVVNYLMHINSDARSTVNANVAELDLDNFGPSTGTADGSSGLGSNNIQVLSISGAGSSTSTAALAIVSGAGTPLYNRGIVIAGNCIPSTGSSIQDITNAGIVLDIRAAPAYAIKAWNSGSQVHLAGLVGLGATPLGGIALRVVNPGGKQVTQLEGQVSALRMKDTAAGADLGIIETAFSNGVSTFRSFNDDGTVQREPLAIDYYNGYVRPTLDAGTQLGAGSIAFGNMYAYHYNGPSDARLKNHISKLADPENDALMSATAEIRDKISLYQWLSSIEEKGTEKARHHVGVYAQDIKAAFEKHGLDPYKLGVIGEDPVLLPVEVTTTHEEHEHALEDVQREVRTVVDGKCVVRQETVQELRAQYLGEMPEHDATGTPLMHPGAPERILYEKDGVTVKRVVAAIAPSPRMHRVPKMVQRSHTETVMQPHPGGETRMIIRPQQLLFLFHALHAREMRAAQGHPPR
jgi:hypothetical protein